MARPGDTLILPAPYKGRIHCPAGALGEDPAPSCLAMLEADGLRHSFSILPEQVPAWRAQVDAYLAFISKIEA